MYTQLTVFYLYVLSILHIITHEHKHTYPHIRGWQEAMTVGQELWAALSSYHLIPYPPILL